MQAQPTENTHPIAQVRKYAQFTPERLLIDVPMPTKERLLGGQLAELSAGVNHDVPFTVLSFNVLAQTLIRREMFPSSSAQALKWPFRRDTLHKEIQTYAADIMCLQEVDFYNEFWLPRVVNDPNMGYGDGHWKQKRAKQDGVAVIWRKSKFECVARQDIEFDELVQAEPYANGGQGSDLSELVRGNVATIVALKRKRAGGPLSPTCSLSTSSGSTHSSSTTSLYSNGNNSEDSEGVIVFNTHLFWNPRYNYVRLVQSAIALEQIALFKAKHGLRWPVIMCGDYNHSSGDASYEALFERSELVKRFEKDPIWLAPKLHYSKYQSWIVTPAQAVLDAEQPPPREPQDENEIQRRYDVVRSLLERFESHELALPISIYREYGLAQPDNPDWKETNQPSLLEPPFTSYSSFWCGPLDYIAVWDPSHHTSQLDSHTLMPLQMLRIPHATEMGPPSDVVNSTRIPKVVELPNDVRASDHLPIMVSFAFQPKF